MNTDRRQRILVCSCEGSMPGYGDSVAQGCKSAQVDSGHQFCGAELHRVQSALRQSEAVTISCTQQAPLFNETAEEIGFEGRLTFANIRETAGWSNGAVAAGPKAAALLAVAAEPVATPALVTLSSEGVILIYGCDETAIEAGRELADKLDVTVLLTRPTEVIPHRVWDFPVMRGTIRNARGHLGAFELAVDDFSAPVPSSRDRLRFGATRDGAISHSDIVLDLSGGVPLFPAHELRPGYVRADPSDPVSLAKAIRTVADFVGEFDKPRFIDFSSELCAHSRSKITGCTRCLDLCPTGAISPAGNHVVIDAAVCAGCGSCAAACPTGAASYALPNSEALLQRLRTLLLTYQQAGGEDAIVLFHDLGHGEPLIDALARFGSGLPANVLPVAVNEITQLGIEAWTAPVAWGASAVRGLTSAKPKHDAIGAASTLTIANLLTQALGYGSDLCALIETDDPDVLASILDVPPRPASLQTQATFLPLGKKRNVLETTMIELHRAAPNPIDRVTLPVSAPFGSVNVDVDGCTLCLSCVAACPTGALTNDEDKPALYFAENACVQCGLCAATCPEDAISLEPQIDFQAWSVPRRLLNEEEPFHCIRCATPFGTKSTIDRIIAKLEGKHWMFAGANAGRLDVVRMCDQCRVEAVMNEGLDPYSGSERPPPRTTEDYLRGRGT